MNNTRNGDRVLIKVDKHIRSLRRLLRTCAFKHYGILLLLLVLVLRHSIETALSKDLEVSRVKFITLSSFCVYSIDLFTDTVAILNKLIVNAIMGCRGGKLKEACLCNSV